LGRELADAVVSVVAPARAHTGWHMLESAVGLAEDARKLAGREAKAAAAAVGQARSALEQAMRAAQVADPTSLAAAITAQEENIEQARARAGALQEQTAARSALLSEVERAERAQQVAETRVAEARERIEQVAQQRAEVVARREALSADLSAARTRYEELVGEARKAEDAAEDPRTALDDARALLKALEEGRTEAPPTEACPCCGEMLALTANGLRWAAEVAAEGVTEEQLAAAREAVESAQADWQEKNGAFLELDQAVQEQRKQLERLEAALGALIDPPSDELLRERLEEAVGASDAAGELLGELRARPMPGPVDAQQIEAAQRAVAEGQERLRLLEAAQAAVAGQQEALQTETSANQEHERLDVLVKRLREIMREQASAMADPVADSLAAMLGRPVVFDPDRGLCLQVDLGDEQALRPLSQLCTGERLQAAAALQGVLAAALGVGLALVDEVSGLDPEHAAETIAVMR